MNAIELYDKNGKPLGFWICGKCKKVTLNPLYSVGSDKAPQNTKEAAELCCTDPVCLKCSQPFKKTGYRYNNYCDTCDAEYWKEQAEQWL